MSSGSAQDVVVENFLRDIERRGQWLHCAVIGCEEEHPCGDMNLLYRKSRQDWRHRDQEGKKSSNYKDASSATVGKVRDLASFRRHFRMGFMTMPASQDLSPHSCAAAMAPRSQSCHAVGTGEGEEMENGYYPDSDPQDQSNPSRCPPAKPKRHPNTRLSSTPQQEHPSRGVHAPPDTPPPPPPNHPTKHPEKRNAMKKSDSGEIPGRKVPPLKPKRSPSTQLSFDPLPPRVQHPTTPLPFQSSEPSPRGEGGDDEPVYIEMVGQVFTRETHSTPTPHPLTPSATTPDSESDHGEAIYEEMKYPLPDDLAREAHRRLPLKHERIKSSKAYHTSIISSSSSSASSLPRPSSSSPACSSSKPKAAVSISHSSPLPSSCSSASSTPVPQALSSSPHPPRAPTPFLLPGSKPEHEPSSSKIPAPFPNLLQHKPPLLAFPQPAAASSGVGAQHKTSSAKISVQSASSLTASTSTSSSMSSTCTSKESSGVEKEREKERREGQLGPAPGLRARSHSTPLPPSSKSSSPYSHHHHHHHPHHRPSHYHHYRKPEKEVSSSSKGTGQSSTQTQTQPKEGKSVSFLLKSEKSERERDRERDRERERDLSTPSSSHSDTPASNTYTHTSQTGTSTTPTLSQPSSSTAATPPSTSSSSTQRPPSRSHMHRSHTPHLSHGLPAYKPPPSDSPLLWTYPSVGFRRPPAYDSLRGGSQLPSLHTDPTKTGSAAQALQAKAGFIPWESAAALGLTEEQAYWPMHRKLSFSHGSRDTEKEDGGAWNGSSDALLRRERDDLGAMRGGGHSGIPVWATGRHSESLAGADGPPGLRGLIRAGLPLPCQTFPACRNGELGRLGRSSSTSGVRQVGGDVQRQSSLPTREAFNQFHALSQVQAQTQSQAPCSPSLSRQQQYQHQQQVQLQFQQLAQLAAQAQAPLSTGTAGTSTTSAQRDGKLLEVIERKRCLCKEIKAHRRPDKSLCKQDSMPILPSWRKTPEPRKTGTPPCQRPQAVVWDTAI
ncbi:neuronal tyrosine-phosphorylated phosphoinositide-3-kinase adapter 1-like [Cyprinus carpio]|uniref:Neuronal tyrosine-phosphorylated phosphoinositide-3-kinase adapter 1-like n=1 Tax=Cyprinus carpio TaxID=7962 RepID=A0A9Q9Y2M9_CYPCA|nr:neuronal tyrosine-phosphorylated phosphoinositide-3-kinase adapter 1-like [Cyprinus carpio]